MNCFIDESLDKLTDFIFGASQCPGYYKQFPRPKGINIYHNEIEHQGFILNNHFGINIQNYGEISRHNGHLEKEIFYQNLRAMKEK